MFSDEEIIKALECCVNGSCWCEICPIGLEEGCIIELCQNTLSLINRQKAEIERLNGICKCVYDKVCELEADLPFHNAKIRAEAISEFAERLKEHLMIETTDNVNEPSVKILYYADETIDQIAKELTEEKE